MAVKAKSRPKGGQPLPKAKSPTEQRPRPKPTSKHNAPVKNAIPQKVLVYATRLGEPPAISDEVPEGMPFATDDE